MRNTRTKGRESREGRFGEMFCSWKNLHLSSLQCAFGRTCCGKAVPSLLAQNAIPHRDASFSPMPGASEIQHPLFEVNDFPLCQGSSDQSGIIPVFLLEYAENGQALRQEQSVTLSSSRKP